MNARLPLALVILTACPLPPSEDDTGSSTSDTATSSTGGTTLGNSATSITATGLDGTGTTEDGSGATSDTADTGASVCDPQPEDLFIWVYLNDEEPEDSFYLSIDADCMVLSVAEDGDQRTYAFECDEEGELVTHELEVSRSTGAIDLPMAEGTPVHLQAVKNFPIDYGGFSYVAIRDRASQLILGSYGGTSIPAEVGVDPDTRYEPLSYALAFGVCDPEPYEEPGDFIMEPCPAQRTRLAIDFNIGDDGVQLLDRNSGQLGQLQLFVNSARHLDPQGECDLQIDTRAWTAFVETN